ncbi:HPP family protein [Marinoscillum sp.]|uniref:HPP family protein n=1 Tax=Marinoscillum sp. TaxID=2024838 RepID=UPI003BAC50C5
MVKKRIQRNIRVVRYVIYKETLVDWHEHVWSFMGSFLGIGLVAWIQAAHFEGVDGVFLIGSFGASGVLIYGAIQSPLAQPRNLIGGHVLSACIGVAVSQVCGDYVSLGAPLAVALSIILMQITKTMHPPGGATALIAVIGSEDILNLGWRYILFPVLSGALILLIVAFVFNNITSKRSYPTNSRFTRVLKKTILIPFRSESL